MAGIDRSIHAIFTSLRHMAELVGPINRWLCGFVTKLVVLIPILASVASLVVSIFAFQISKYMFEAKRPWVSIEIDVNRDQGEQLTFSGDDASIPIDIKVVNTGDLPALHALAYAHLFPIPIAAKEMYSASQRRGLCNLKSELPVGRALFHGQERTFRTIATTDNTAGTRTPLPQDGLVRFVVAGCVRYEDPRDGKHYFTGFWSLISYSGSPDQLSFTLSQKAYPTIFLSLIAGAFDYAE